MARKPIFPGNISIDEKRIAFIERVISRLVRRSHRVASAMIPPVPITAYVSNGNISGSVLKSLLFKGKIIKGAIQFGNKPKGEIRVDVKLLVDNKGTTKTFYVSGMKDTIDVDVETFDGSILEVSIYPINDKDVITEVFVSLLWISHRQNSEVKKFLIDELEALEETNA